MKRKQVIFAEEVLKNNVNLGEKVAVIGGALVGCETAHFLAEKGKAVTILEIRKGKNIIGKDIGYSMRYPLLNSLKSYGVRMLPGVITENITEDGIVICCEGKKRDIIESAPIR